MGLKLGPALKIRSQVGLLPQLHLAVHLSLASRRLILASKTSHTLTYLSDELLVASH